MWAIVNDWRALLDGPLWEEELQDLRDHVRASHPLESASFASKPGRPARLPKHPNQARVPGIHHKHDPLRIFRAYAIVVTDPKSMVQQACGHA